MTEEQKEELLHMIINYGSVCSENPWVQKQGYQERDPVKLGKIFDDIEAYLDALEYVEEKPIQ